MSDVEFLVLNKNWMETALPYFCEGGLPATLIDWRGFHIVHAATTPLALAQINHIVLAKTNAGMGGFYRSQHEFLPIYKKGQAPASTMSSWERTAAFVLISGLIPVHRLWVRMPVAGSKIT